MAYLFPYAGDDTRPKARTKIKKPRTPSIHQIRRMREEAAWKEQRESEGMPAPMPKLLWDIMKRVCDKHRCMPSELYGISRKQKFIMARREYVFRARTETTYSFPRIAKTINKDHTTAIHAYMKAVEDGMTKDKDA